MFAFVKAVFASKGFNEMSEETLVFILKSDKLDMEESDILEKVKEWANISSVSSLLSHRHTVVVQLTMHSSYHLLPNVCFHNIR